MSWLIPGPDASLYLLCGVWVLQVMVYGFYVTLYYYIDRDPSLERLDRLIGFMEEVYLVFSPRYLWYRICRPFRHLYWDWKAWHPFRRKVLWMDLAKQEWLRQHGN